MNLRPDLPPLIPRIAKLPRDERGYPVPFFVAWPDGKPEFRMMDHRKLVLCIKEELCWCCGEKLGSNKAFLIGPMCAINRNNSEPPNHLDCAGWAARACPFLVKPQMVRRDHEAIEALAKAPAGVAIKRNPGCVAVWVTKKYHRHDDGRGGILFDIGDPVAVQWYREARAATRAEVDESIATGLPLLLEACATDEDRALLRQYQDRLAPWLPAAV